MSTDFSHTMQQFLIFKPSPIQVPKNKVSRHFRWFFNRGWHWDGSIRRLNNGWVVAGRMAGKGMTFEMSEEGKGVE